MDEFLKDTEWWYQKDLKKETQIEFHAYCQRLPVEQCDAWNNEMIPMNEEFTKFMNQKNDFKQDLVGVDIHEVSDKFEFGCKGSNFWTKK